MINIISRELLTLLNVEDINVHFSHACVYVVRDRTIALYTRETAFNLDKGRFRFDALNTREDHENFRVACTSNLKDGTLSAT